jgi:hypothetical protein
VYHVTTAPFTSNFRILTEIRALHKFQKIGPGKSALPRNGNRSLGQLLDLNEMPPSLDVAPLEAEGMLQVSVCQRFMAAASSTGDPMPAIAHLSAA